LAVFDWGVVGYDCTITFVASSWVFTLLFFFSSLSFVVRKMHDMGVDSTFSLLIEQSWILGHFEAK
jgi:uncharacterized membrane protein YhaH (DUF805 family)